MSLLEIQTEPELAALFADAGLELQESVLKLGPGLARFARGRWIGTCPQ